MKRFTIATTLLFIGTVSGFAQTIATPTLPTPPKPTTDSERVQPAPGGGETTGVVTPSSANRAPKREAAPAAASSLPGPQQ